MKIAYCGAHRTGKSTLAKAVSGRLGLPYVPTRTGSVITDMGYRADVYNGFPVRKYMQDALYDAYFEDFSKHPSFVTDRCYIDLIAFMMMEVNNDIDEACSAWSQEYIKKLIASQQDFDCVIVVPPAIQVVAAPGKASTIQSLIDKIHLLCVGVLAMHNVPHLVIPTECTNLDVRIAISMAHIESLPQ